MSTVPKWADATLSAGLAQIAEAGENATIEFKVTFPEQGHRLSQELAALATSGGGTLYLGIDDAGTIVGIDVPDGEIRDEVVRRAFDLARGVRPNLKIEPKFAIADGKAVLVIVVPSQDEPVYFYEGRPYIRDGSTCRTATPEEVKHCVWSHPSADYKREVERIRLQQLQGIADSGRRHADAMDELHRRYR